MGPHQLVLELADLTPICRPLSPTLVSRRLFRFTLLPLDGVFLSALRSSRFPESSWGPGAVLVIVLRSTDWQVKQ